MKKICLIALALALLCLASCNGKTAVHTDFEMPQSVVDYMIAGNVIGDYELGSVEYGAEHLHTKLVLVLGHTNCGAVDAALSGGAHGYIEKITDEISSCVPDGCDAREAEILNVKNSIAEIMKSEAMQELTESGAVAIRGAIYDIESGAVEFLDD